MTLIIGIATIAGALASVLALCVNVHGRQIRTGQLQTLEAKEANERLALRFNLSFTSETLIELKACQTASRKPSVSDELRDRIAEMPDAPILHFAGHGAIVDVPPLSDDVIRIDAVIPKSVGQTPKKQKLLRRAGNWVAGSTHSRTTVRDVPSWILGLMSADDAQRYSSEWGAHLLQLIEEGEVGQARRDRRRFVIATITLAVALRVRRAFGRAR
jgi:hypothetical protein